MNTRTVGGSNGSDQALRAAWERVSRERAIEFLRLALGAESTIEDVMRALSSPPMAELREQLKHVTLLEVLSGHDVSKRVRKWHKKRQRIKAVDVVAGEELVLAMIKKQPGVRLQTLHRVLSGVLARPDKSHVQRLVSRLVSVGAVERRGDRGAARYYST